MRIPQTISRNTASVYLPSKVILGRLLNAEDLTEWRKIMPKRLSEICLDLIATNWEDQPILNELSLNQDVRFLLDSLPTNLPYALTVSEIEDEAYWKRCYVSRWPKKLPNNVLELSDRNFLRRDSQYSVVSVNSEISSEEEMKPSWKQCFLEMHLQDVLENLQPELYNPEEIKDLVDLCKNYVRILILNQLKAPNMASKQKERIPLHSIISGLPYLKELRICYKQTHAGEDFSWHILQTTLKDIINLAHGLKKCVLHIFRIINSDIDCDKVRILAHGLLENKHLKLVDFSHCKIGKDGVIALSRLLKDMATLETLILSNNYIGPEGVEYIAYSLTLESTKLKLLNLELNCIGTKGANYLASALTNNDHLKILRLAGCGFNHEMESFAEMLRRNKALEIIDLNNNKFGKDMGEHFLHVLKQNHSLQGLDLRMTGIPSSGIFAIEELLKSRTGSSAKSKPITMDCYDGFVILDQDEIVVKQENVFNNIEDNAEDDFEVIVAETVNEVDILEIS